MNYPTLEEVDAADRIQLCRWYRFLQSPGMAAVGQPDWGDTFAREMNVMNRIIERWKAAGGFTPEISKQIGH